MRRPWFFWALLGVTLVSGVAAQPEPREDVLILFRNTRDQADEALVRGAGGSIRRSFRIVPAVAASLPARAIQALQNNPRIEVIEPDATVEAIDAELDQTWGVLRVGAGVAHESTPPIDGAGINVAVIDTGVQYLHEDLIANYRGGWDFVNNDADPMDDCGHGTHVSGTIAAARNGIGVVGVAPAVNLYALKVLSPNGNNCSGSLSNIIAAVEWAASHGMHVTNNSYGGSGFSVTADLAFANAAAAGVLHVAAAGNGGTCAGTGNVVGYPAGYRSVVAVAATDSSDARACFSSTGPDVEMAAPGVQINSTIKSGGYGSKWNGTSMASPHVAGAAALLFGLGVIDGNGDGRITDEVRNILARTAEDLGAPGRDALHGFGLVNVPEAIAAASTFPPLSATVDAISFANVGGGGKDLGITIGVAYGLVAPVAGAAVSGQLLKSGAVFSQLNGTTGVNGSVTFTIKNPRNGMFSVVITSVVKSGLTWDSLTPINSVTR
jgi:subtilisin family serine protease